MERGAPRRVRRVAPEVVPLGRVVFEVVEAALVALGKIHELVARRDHREAPVERARDGRRARPPCARAAEGRDEVVAGHGPRHARAGRREDRRREVDRRRERRLAAGREDAGPPGQERHAPGRLEERVLRVLDAVVEELRAVVRREEHEGPVPQARGVDGGDRAADLRVDVGAERVVGDALRVDDPPDERAVRRLDVGVLVGPRRRVVQQELRLLREAREVARPVVHGRQVRHCELVPPALRGQAHGMRREEAHVREPRPVAARGF